MRIYSKSGIKGKLLTFEATEVYDQRGKDSYVERIQKAMQAGTLPSLPQSCFYFVDTKKALIERDGRRAAELNGKRGRVSKGRKIRRCACQHDRPLTRLQRIESYRWFYAESASEGQALSPFDT